MKAADLRIGNLVRVDNPKYQPYVTGKIFSIIKIDSKDDSISVVCIEDIPHPIIFEQYLKHIKPIPLTPDELVKLGFEKVENKEIYIIRINGDYTLELSCNGFSNHDDGEYWVTITGYYQKVTLTKRYVHELQNLLHSLTGKITEVLSTPLRFDQMKKHKTIALAMSELRVNHLEGSSIKKIVYNVVSDTWTIQYHERYNFKDDTFDTFELMTQFIINDQLQD